MFNININTNTNININCDNVYRHESGSNNYEKHMVLSGSGNEIDGDKHCRETKETKEEDTPPSSSDDATAPGEGRGSRIDDGKLQIVVSSLLGIISLFLNHFR